MMRRKIILIYFPGEIEKQLCFSTSDPWLGGQVGRGACVQVDRWAERQVNKWTSGQGAGGQIDRGAGG